MDWEKTDMIIAQYAEQHNEITKCVGWEECQCNRCKLARLHFDNPRYRTFILEVYRTLKKYSASQSRKTGEFNER